VFLSNGIIYIRREKLKTLVILALVLILVAAVGELNMAAAEAAIKCVIEIFK